MMTDEERAEMMKRCHEAELRCQVLTDCLNTLAGKFAAITSGLVGLRINKLEDAKSDHGARLGDLEASKAKTDEAIDKARQAYGRVERRLNAEQLGAK